ncbi:MAG: hypothetical protein CMG55_08765 [Candidatus Marinimicrobia bacterium]|nr:hypothetical protein [Candidatus Neomarinimicrobiota bacterium]|tara:strand:- start:248 stop:973 length:726 start_codon:yes stop_codon:yes gene_type:complete
MIDIHNHIFPNIDDGSKSKEMSIEMLKNAYKQGITDVVNTVHYQHPMFQDIDLSFDSIYKVSQDLQNEINQIGINIKIHIASEVFYYDNLLKIKNNKLTTMGNGKYMLIEFHPNNIPVSQKEVLYNLKIEGVTPIIAHPERYRQVQKDINYVYDWLNSGCLIQIDAGSLIGLLGENCMKTSRLIIQENLCQILASDAHNNAKRNFCLKDGHIYTKSILGDKADLLVYHYPKVIIEGGNISL